MYCASISPDFPDYSQNVSKGEDARVNFCLRNYRERPLLYHFDQRAQTGLAPAGQGSRKPALCAIPSVNKCRDPSYLGVVLKPFT